eukprot:TRINITY_DN1659_c0_g1_i15.p1 TRINITY_DN1659_c0_g1~~TRINITY_DN1659_c0_g1_i15.p1  ORF type:complete len:206 (-),score=39.78 TRINITY_DN1659_c0_g1_i15:310-927(-)
MWFPFLFLAGGHLYCGYKSVQCVEFKTLDQQRTSILLALFFSGKDLYTPQQMKETSSENIVWVPAHQKCKPFIDLGSSVIHSFSSQDELYQHYNIFQNKNFIVSINKSGDQVNVLLKENINSRDLLEGFFCAFKTKLYLQKFHERNTKTTAGIEELSKILTRLEILSMMLRETEATFDDFYVQLKEKGWHTAVVTLGESQNKVTW